MERRPDGTLLFRLGQPLHQIVIVVLVALMIATVFIYGAIDNEEALEIGGEVWAGPGIVSIALGLAGLFSFAISFPLLLALRARLAGRQGVRLEARRIVLAGLHYKGDIQFQYSEIVSAELVSMGLNKLIRVKAKDDQQMTIPVPLFKDQADPQRLIRHLRARMPG